MKTKLLSALVGIACLGLAGSSQAILITSDTIASDLANAVAAGATGLTVVSSTLSANTSGNAVSSGTYTNASNTYGIGPGIVISSGDVNNYNTGPNNAGNTTTAYGVAATAPQTAILQGITGQSSFFDATQLDITFTTTTGSVFFNVVFGSEEFSEFVGSSFIDGFGLLLDGVNIAFVNTLPVNINHPAMAFVPGTELDGILCPQPAAGGPCNPVLTFSASGLNTSNHTLTFIVADASDPNLDTTAYIASLGGTAPPPPNPTPEPASLALLGIGLAGLGVMRRKQRA